MKLEFYDWTSDIRTIEFLAFRNQYVIKSRCEC